ncbi:hypothetical protein [Tenacibaculum aiptasiae]|uniref:hypothetical protein n=1 Tax=Tenacibaculum aiptasiae TaxID=426481 RepID=UPI003B58F7AB
MDLQKLLTDTNSKAIFLIDHEGQIVDFFPKENELVDLKEKIAAFDAVIFNMSENFFNLFFNTELNEIILKSTNETLLLFKHEEYVLCFLTDKATNIGLLSLMLKKQMKNTQKLII